MVSPARFVIERGDITTAGEDAIVNAANSSLLGGGGVDGAIHRAGGPDILDACQELRRTRLSEGLPTGQAVATTGGNLRSQWVIHTVGPVYSTSEDRSELLASCYAESLRVAEEIGATSVAFPAISAGVYGWPMGSAADIALRAVAASTVAVTSIRFVLFSSEALAEFQRAHAELQH